MASRTLLRLLCFMAVASTSLCGPFMCRKHGETPKRIDTRSHGCNNGTKYKKIPNSTSTPSIVQTTHHKDPPITAPSPPIDDVDKCSEPITCQGRKYCGTPFTKCCGSLTYDPSQQTCCMTVRYKTKVHDGKMERDHVCCNLEAYAKANLKGIPCPHPIQNDRFWKAKRAKPRLLARHWSKYDHAYIVVFQKRNKRNGRDYYDVDTLPLNITKGPSGNAGVVNRELKALTHKDSPKKNLSRKIFLVFSHTANRLENAPDLILGRTDIVLRLPSHRCPSPFKKLLKACNIPFKPVQKFLKAARKRKFNN